MILRKISWSKTGKVTGKVRILCTEKFNNYFSDNPVKKDMKWNCNSNGAEKNSRLVIFVTEECSLLECVAV